MYGDKSGSFTIALVGDSHASQWFPALERLALHEGWKVVTFVKVSCPFVDFPVTNSALKREYRECADFNTATIKRLNEIKPDLTLVSMSRIAIHPLNDRDKSVAARGASIGRMLGRLPGRVAIIVDTPYAGIDVPGCLASHLNEFRACDIGRGTAFSHDFGKTETIAAEASGAALIDLTAKFVPGPGPLPPVINNMIVYRDQAHMTATFSRSLAPALEATIAALLER